MIAAIVAVAQTWTAASRTPVAISGIASGSSTRRQTCKPVIPMPTAARVVSAVDLAQARCRCW